MATLTTSWQSIASAVWDFGDTKVTFYLDAKYSTQDIANNRTTIQTRLRSVLEYGWGNGYNYSFTCSYANSVSGTGIWYLATETITEGGSTIDHNADGTKSLTLTATAAITGLSRSSTLSANVTLPTIPRATACPNIDAYIGSTSSIYLSPASTSFTHILKATYGGSTITLGSFQQFLSYTFGDSWYNLTPGKTGTGTLTLQTYSGNTLIGTSTGTLTLRCNENNCSPQITASVIDSNSTTTALTGDSNKIVKGYSNARITYTATGRKNATITSVKANNITLGSSPATLNGVTTNVFVITATDSRGYSTSTTITKTLIDYVNLSLNINAFRTTPTGSEVKVNFTGSYFNGSFGNTNNSLTLNYKVKEKGGSTWLKEATLTLNTDYKISGNTFYSGNGNSASDIVLDSSIFNYQKIYEIYFYYNDALLSYNQVLTIAKGVAKLSFDDDYVYIDDQPILTYDIIDTW